MAPRKSDFSETEKKKFLMAPWKSDFTETEKIAFSWRSEKAIFGNG